MSAFERSVQLVRDAVEKKMIPSAALAIGVKDKLYVKEAFGVTSYTPEATMVNTLTLYDIASVTKIMATTMITLRYIADGLIDLTDRLPRFFGELVPKDKQEITLFQLLTHTSGYQATILLEKYLKPGTDPTEYLLKLPLVYKPGCGEIYSDIGFILLGKILERISGKTLDVLAYEEVFSKLGMNRTSYHPLDKPIDPTNTAYTERNHLTGEWLCGQVDDENAYFMNGVAGNAGVFTDLEDSIRYATMLANHGVLDGKMYLPERIFDRAIQNYTPGMAENRGLGFNLSHAYNDTTFSGLFFDQGAFGHTGFTGPHILVAPETGLYVVLLNNRVHPTRENLSHLRLRRLLHTMVSIEYDEMMKKK